jgi:hypothetical protein
MAFHYSPNVVSDGLVNFFDFANTKSYTGTGLTCSDMISTQYTGTHINGPVFSTENSGILTFDGTNDHIATNYTSPFGTNTLTVGVWFSFTASQIGAIFSKRMGAASYEQLSMFVCNDPNANVAGTKLNFSDFNNPASRIGLTTATFNDGLWHYATLVRDTTQNRYYVDGVLQSTVTSGVPNLSSSSRLFIGGLGENLTYVGASFRGSISMFQIYNRALTADEVLQNYNTQKSRFGG